jgi:hypothetical protein
VIHGCFQKKTGSLRVIFGKQRCGKSEKAISWHQTGPQGLQGNPGAQGPHGNAGATGPSPGPLPTGKTLRGNYNMGGTAAVAGALANTAISFIFQFVSAPNFNYIAPGGSSTAACPGSAASRSATPGNLCVYSQGVLNNRRPEQQHRPMGDTPYVNATVGGEFYDFGVWAATSP